MTVEFTVVEVELPYAQTRLSALMAESLMRADQDFLGEHGLDALIVAQRIRQSAYEQLERAMILGDAYDEPDTGVPPCDFCRREVPCECAGEPCMCSCGRCCAPPLDPR